MYIHQTSTHKYTHILHAHVNTRRNTQKKHTMHIHLNDERHAAKEGGNYTQVCVHIPHTYIHKYTHTINTPVNTHTNMRTETHTMHMQLDAARHASKENRYYSQVCVHTPHTYTHKYTHTINTPVNKHKHTQRNTHNAHAAGR